MDIHHEVKTGHVELKPALLYFSIIVTSIPYPSSKTDNYATFRFEDKFAYYHSTCYIDAICRNEAETMKRTPNPMPEDVAEALKAERLMESYIQRPWYQRNDYLGWISQAKRKETKMKRLQQMLKELSLGDVYMKMAWRQKK